MSLTTSSASSSTPIDDILADAAETSADGKRTIRTPDHFTQYSEFGGVADLNISIRIPNSFYEAVKEYCNIAKMPVREWFNNAIIDQIEYIDLDFVKNTFIKKYHLRELSIERRAAMIQSHRRVELVEEMLTGE